MLWTFTWMKAAGSIGCRYKNNVSVVLDWPYRPFRHYEISLSLKILTRIFRSCWRRSFWRCNRYCDLVENKIEELDFIGCLLAVGTPRLIPKMPNHVLDDSRAPQFTRYNSDIGSIFSALCIHQYWCNVNLLILLPFGMFLNVVHSVDYKLRNVILYK